MTSLAEAFRDQQAGDFASAEEGYRRVLAVDPREPDAWYLLGGLCHMQGRLPEAVQHYRKALDSRPDHAETRHNLGAAYDALGNAEDAVTQLREAMRLKPEFAEPRVSLGFIYQRRGQTAEAVRCLEDAVRLRPDLAEAHYRLGVALFHLGRGEEGELSLRRALSARAEFPEALHDLGFMLAFRGQHSEAIACYRQALSLRPDYAEAFNNLGRALLALDRAPEAIDHLREAIRLGPNSPHAHNNLGTALGALGRQEEAIGCYREAVRLLPAFPEAWSNLGLALADQEQVDEAVACHREAIRCQPNLAAAHQNLGVALTSQGKLDEALACHERALALNPEYAQAHLCRAFILLKQEKLQLGWPGYEWRWRTRGFHDRGLGKPSWTGAPLEGRTILLFAEQGFGDTIQFVRYATLVSQRGGRVIIECQAPLVSLVATCAGVDQVIPAGSALPGFDTRASIMSLPGIFQTSMETIPAEVPYLRPDPAAVGEQERQISSDFKGLKIGIAWQGSPTQTGDRDRSVPLALFEPLARVDGVRLYSFQKGPGEEQIAELAGRFSIVDVGSRFRDFRDTAAALSLMDLVITIDSAVAHCAGALGIPGWVVLAFACDWRYFVDREDCPWYPTMRLFRQRRPGDWDDVFARVLRALSSSGTATRSSLRP